MCESNHAGVECATSRAGKDARQRDAVAPVDEAQKFWLRSLFGVLGCLASDRLDTLYLVENFTREVTHSRNVQHSSSNTMLVKGRYLLRSSRNLDAFAKGDWAPKGDSTQEQFWRREKTWRIRSPSSTTQGAISLSSGEAELHAVNSSWSSSMCHPTAAVLQRPVALCRPVQTDSVAARGRMMRLDSKALRKKASTDAFTSQRRQDSECRPNGAQQRSNRRRLAFFDVVAAFVHALVDEMVMLLLPRGLRALCGTRKASRLGQRFLREMADAVGWKASVIFESMCTLGDKRGTLGEFPLKSVRTDEISLWQLDLNRGSQWMRVEIRSHVVTRTAAQSRFNKT